jgi:hypothetical protein
MQVMPPSVIECDCNFKKKKKSIQVSNLKQLNNANEMVNYYRQRKREVFAGMDFKNYLKGA